jgi:thioredoxin 1
MSGNGNCINVTDDTFETEVIKSERPVVVDFWGEHCSYCRPLGFLLDELAVGMGDRAKFVKADVALTQQWASGYRVAGLPTVLVIKKGEVVGQWAGLPPKKTLVSRLEGAIATP